MLTPHQIADGLCAMTISTLGNPDEAKWWDIWQAAVQLNGMCVRAGKKGKNPRLGVDWQLSIDVRATGGEGETGGLSNGTVVSGEGLSNCSVVNGDGLSNGTVVNGDGAWDVSTS